MLSLAAYAKRRGVSTVAVSKAIAAGRLRESVGRDHRGAPKIADPDLADREWDANTRRRIDAVMAPAEAPAAPEVPAPIAATPSPRSEERPRQRALALPDGVPAYAVSQAIRAQAAARREAAAADIAELELGELRGRLVDATTARADVERAYSLVKTRLLGVPSAAAQKMPDLASRIVPVLEALIVEALEELAG